MKKIVTKADYVQSLKDQKVVIYYNGKPVEDRSSHPGFVPHINSASKTYELALMPEHEDLMTAKSHLTGRKISRFTHIHQSIDDLIRKVQMLRLISHETASCYQRCVGFDALNAVYMTAYEIDEKHGTSYFARFEEYLKKIQEENFMLVGGMTDPKGDRSKRPSTQADADLFTRVVEKRSDGVVIRGAKAHQTGAVNSHEIMIMPTQAMGPGDEDYAIVAAIPLDTPGITLIFGRQTNEERKVEGSIDAGNVEFGMVGGEALVIFEDVFVPWERVFMCGEADFCGTLVERFATLHRQNYGGCKGGVVDIMVGATALAAQYQGTLSASHIKDKLVEMTHLNETMFACGIACSAEGVKMPAGNYQIDLLLANVTKQNVTRFPYEIARLAEDITGGLMVTMPSAQDLAHEQLGPIVEKYLMGACDTPTIDRMRILRLVENITLGTAAVGYRTESMHGAGSPQAQRIMIARQSNIDHKKELAKAIAGVGKPWDQDKLKVPTAVAAG